MKTASTKTKSRAKTKKYKQLQAAHMQQGLLRKIEKSNIGYEMIVKMGYQAGQGLGKDGKGILQPLPLDVKTDRKGVGATTSANNVAATTLESRVEHKDTKALQLATITVLGKVNKQKSSEKQCQPGENKVNKDNRKGIESTKPATCTVPAKVNLSKKQSQPKKNNATKDDLKGIEATKLATSRVSTNMQKGMQKKIEKGNIGSEMIVKMGYQAGQGLGKYDKRIPHPLPSLEVKNDRKDVGATTSANNVAATTLESRVEHKDIKALQLATITVLGKVNAQKVNKDNRKGVESTKPATCTVPAKVNLSKKQSQPKKNNATKDNLKGIKATKLATSRVSTNMQKGMEKKIEKGNIGYKMIVKMGYQAGQGLGKDGKGILQPLPLEVKTDRKGVGATMSANNVAATTLESRVDRKDIKAIQLATITVLGKVNAQKSPSEKQCQPKEIKATKDDRKGIQPTKAANCAVPAKVNLSKHTSRKKTLLKTIAEVLKQQNHRLLQFQRLKP